jgi:pSer/pThr/pTyr-binding forkhead associated (FHA) protein
MIKLIVKAQTDEGAKEFSYEFDQPVVTIGRLKENDIQLPISTVSGFHAQILKEGSDYYLIDRGSINGTYLNGQRLIGGEKKLLEDSDLIKIQTFELYFSSGITMMGNVDQGATVQVARQMVMEVLGSWKTTSQEKPRIIVMGGPNNGKQYELTEGKSLILGRTAECDIQIDHPSVSRKHAEIAMSWSGTFINDFSSANGVFVDDLRIAGSQKLRDRDEIRLGQQTSANPIVLTFSNPADALLSKIESMQITDSNPGVVSSKALTDAAEQQHLAKAEEGANLPAIREVPQVEKQVSAPPPPVIEAPPVESEPSFFSRMLSMPGAIIALLLLLVVIGILAMIMFYGKAGTLSLTAEPMQGGVGDTITLIGENLQEQEIQGVRILNKDARISRAEEDQIQVQLPAVPDLEALETRTDIVVQGPKGVLAQVPFTFITKPRIESINPQSGGSGTEIRVKTNKVGSKASVYFGSNQAIVKSRTNGELVAVVPQPAETVPDTGLSIPVSIRVNDTPSANAVNFLVLSEQKKPAEVLEKFELTFVAKPYAEPLGFNEYSVATNFAPLLVVAGADEYESSRERAEAIAKSLNDAREEFKKSPTAEVVLKKEDDNYALYTAKTGTERLLTRVLPEDAQAYSKLNRRTVGLQELSEWWQMLLDSYYRVFVQIKDPTGTGILSSGGSVLQQIYKFYPVGTEGEKYYKKDFLNSLPADQKGRLISLSLAIPYVVARVDGKWSGAMTNEIYSNIADNTLELTLILRQGDGGGISGTAELTWKRVMDSSGGNYENVAYKKLGVFNLHGTYQKGKGIPLEFSFVEKDSRRLDFSGKVDGNILKGKYVASSGEEGTWTVQHIR